MGGYQRPHGIQNYKGIKESGYIDDWLTTLDRAYGALKWNGEQKFYNLVTYLDPVVEEHLRTYADIHSESYENICAILRRKYGAERMREHCRNNFQFNSQKTDESTEDFLDRLMREHKTGWPDAESTTRDKEVLNILVQGVKDVQLGQTLDNEYQKPQYINNPPRVDEVRNYIHRLASFKEIMKKKKEMTMNKQSAETSATTQATKDYLNPLLVTDWKIPAGQRTPIRWNCQQPGHMSYFCPNPTVAKGTPATRATRVATPAATVPTPEDSDQRLEAARRGFRDFKDRYQRKGESERHKVINEKAEIETAQAPKELQVEAKEYWTKWASEEKQNFPNKAQDQGN